MARRPVRKPPRDKTVPPQDGVAALWSRYFAAGKPETIRDQIVTHYFGWVRRTAIYLAKRVGLRDHENAVGEALQHFSMKVVPRYRDGEGHFEAWAVLCLRRRLLDLRRQQEERLASLDAPLGDDGEAILADMLPARANREEPSDFRFGEFVAELEPLLACLLWLHFYRGMSFREAAESLHLPPRQGRKLGKKAIAQLRKLHRVG